MNNQLIKIVLGACILTSSFAFAEVSTSTNANWICTTNASSSNVDADRAADKQMTETAQSAAGAFAFAAQNCRDCTEIKCSIKQ